MLTYIVSVLSKLNTPLILLLLLTIYFQYRSLCKLVAFSLLAIPMATSSWQSPSPLSPPPLCSLLNSLLPRECRHASGSVKGLTTRAKGFLGHSMHAATPQQGGRQYVLHGASSGLIGEYVHALDLIVLPVAGLPTRVAACNTHCDSETQCTTEYILQAFTLKTLTRDFLKMNGVWLKNNASVLSV